MRLLTFSLFLFITLLSFGQYNNPYRIFWDGNSYFVTNKGSGNIVKIDSAFNTSTIITGLTSPNEVFYGSFGGNTALLVIDDNKLKLYDAASFSLFTAIDITGATEAHDAVYDYSNTNVFYVSDRAGNKILKGTVGGPPFYPVTFTTLVSGISKPAGMLYDNQGRLLVVSDTLDAAIFSINTSTGSFDTVASTNLDYLNDLVQDAQGNFYTTSWGDNNLYRFNSNFGEKYAVATYSNPSGMFVNSTYDYLAMCCHNCNKVEFSAFHLFSPLDDITSCVGDSIDLSFNPVYKGIGTFNSDNYFIAELSDSAGNFTNAIKLGGDSGTLNGGSFRGYLPQGNYSGTGYQYRFRSTSPPWESYFQKQVFPIAAPNSTIYNSDSLTLCAGSEVTIGPTAQTDVKYSWSPGNTFTDSTKAKVKFTANNGGAYALGLSALDTINGCASNSEIVIVVAPDLAISNLNDSFDMCPGDTINIGIDGLPFIMNWTGNAGIEDASASNPRYYGGTSNIYLTFTDSAMNCSGEDSLYITEKALPVVQYPNLPYTEATCINEIHSLELAVDTSLAYNWLVSGGTINNANTANPSFEFDTEGTYNVDLEFTDPITTCSNQSSFNIEAFFKPALVSIMYNGDLVTILDTAYGPFVVEWYRNGTVVDNGGVKTFNKQLLADGDSLQARIVIPDAANMECEVWSNKIVRDLSSINSLNTRFSVNPNPSSGQINIVSNQPIVELSIYNFAGIKVQSQTVEHKTQLDLNMDSVASGIYWIDVTTTDGFSRKKLIIQ